uniref:Uncharacterized protein n=1 Tax=Acrobeloides nanus TaxID=290746 RepID=A0A914CWH0_9BILA
MRKCSFLVSEQLDDSLMIQFLEILPLRQILLAFPNNEKMLKQEPNVAKMLSDMQELVDYVAEHKDLEQEQLILATANNACKLMPKLKAICDEIVEQEADIEEAESEEEHDDSSGIGSVTVHEKPRKEEYRKEEVEYQQNRNYQDLDSELENFDERYDTSSFVELLMDQNAKLELLRAYVEMLRNQQSPAISSEELDEIYNKNDNPSINKQKPQKQSPTKNSDKKSQNTKETKKPSQVRKIVNGCFQDNKGRWRDVSTGRYCKAPEGFETAETPKKPFSLKSLFNNSKKQASDDNKPPKQVDTQGKYFQDFRGRWHGPDGKFCKPPAGAETMVNSKSSEVTKTNGAAQPNEKKTYEGGYYLDSRNRWHGPDGKFCTPPVNVTQHTTPIKTSPVAQMPAKVVPNPTSERKTTPDGYFQDVRGRWHGPNGKFSKPPELLKTSSPVPPPPVQVSTPVVNVSSNTQNSTSSTRITTSDGNYQDANGRWHGANGRFIKAPEPPSYSSYTPSYSSNYGSSGYSS